MRKSISCFGGEGKCNMFPVKSEICVFRFLNGDVGLPSLSALCSKWITKGSICQAMQSLEEQRYSTYL